MMIAKMTLSVPCVLSRSSSPALPFLLCKNPKPFGFASLASRSNDLLPASVSLNFRKKTLFPIAASAPASTVATAASPISVGDKLPDATFAYCDKDGQVQTVTVADLTKGKKAVLFAVPGAFTPTCSQQHLPGFVQKAAELRAKGVETIACIAVNDVFVLRAWGENSGVGDKVMLLSDGNVTFTKALGATLDLSDKPIGLGIRSRRYSLLAEDGVVKVLNLEEGGAFTSSGAEEILKAL
uniref:Glutaredoxin-dependent peroxiredoxin n=1 Tax=Hymenophyllum caudiculatum TaxID=295381 RepID=A0A2P1JJ47_9MONI|nr:chloroplast Peroxiredoxin-2E-2 [Hymenophyllum caudiculatum]